MSAPLHHFTPAFGTLSSSPLVVHRHGVPQQHIPTSGLDTLAESSQYELQQLQHSSMTGHQMLASNKSPVKTRHHPYSNDNHSPSNHRQDSASDSRGGIKKSSSSAPVRRRISRACDQCNQLRTKCDGKTPCAHCIEFQLACEYARERKKRGKASKKDLAQQQVAAGAAGSGSPASPNGQSSEGPSPIQTTRGQEHLNNRVQNAADPGLPQVPSTRSMSMSSATPTISGTINGARDAPRSGSLGTLAEVPNSAHLHQQPLHNMPCGPNMQHQMGNGLSGIGLGAYGPIHGIDRSTMHMNGMGGLQMMQNATHNHQPGMLPSQGYHGYPENTYHMMGPQDHHGTVNGFRFGGTGESPSANFMGISPAAGSPGWLSLPSPSSANYASYTPPSNTNVLRYPVLQPLIPDIGSIIPQSLACDLLDLYFTSSSSAHMRPLSPYLLGYIFRKKSFVHPTRPRSCSPALLASMLWIGAQTSDAAFLTSPPSARGRVCQKLQELTVGLLKPLIHGPTPGETSPNYPANMVINGVALGGFGVSMDQLGAESGATGALDDVATYIHLATVVSASEYKAASMRWWNAAWSLARELKLGRELPPNPLQGRQDNASGDDADADGDVDIEMQGHHRQTSNPVGLGIETNNHAPSMVTEEEREERRRIWWLLYTVDRHLALCYNRPLFLLDKECDGLLQPMNDTLWQAGDFSNADLHLFPTSPTTTRYRRRGPNFECTGHSIFGYFLPLMTILGEIVDLNHARNHPRFGLGFRSATEWDDQAQEITHQLDAYGQSLREFEARFTTNLTMTNENENGGEGAHSAEVATPSVRSVSTAGRSMTESIIQTKIMVAYGTHIMHVLHILLTGKWDPISLLDDNDLWISSQSFISATGHAVKAAEAVSDILEHDPDLSFMPFFFGVYLLQGSFLLLLIADKLQGDASPSVVKACETIVRAHEACVATLNTEYQRNFRKVMRSALAQVRGRIPEDFGEQQQRRREVLALYRWTGDGSGLAL